MKTLTTLTIRQSDGAVQLIELPSVESAKLFLGIYAARQLLRLWEGMELTMIRYSIEHFELDSDGDWDEVDSKDYVQTLNNFKVRV